VITPPAVLAAVRATAVAEGLPIVSLRGAPSLRLVVRLDQPIAELRAGRLVPLVRQLGERLPGARWELVAVDRRGRRLRQSRGFPNGGEAWIRPDLDGCDPSYVIIGRPIMSPFSNDPRCAGDPAAPVGRASNVDGAVVGKPFPLTVAADGLRLLAEVDDRRYASRPLLGTTSTVGAAVLRRDGTLLVTLGATPVVLAPA
jgi:hypothetical protein